MGNPQRQTVNSIEPLLLVLNLLLVISGSDAARYSQRLGELDGIAVHSSQVVLTHRFVPAERQSSQ